MKNRVDKGRCLSYDRLSSRRKFFRSLYMMPFPLFLFLFPNEIFMYLADVTEMSVISRTVVVLFMIFVFFLQAIYNFYMWRKESAGEKNNRGQTTNID